MVPFFCAHVVESEKRHLVSLPPRPAAGQGAKRIRNEKPARGRPGGSDLASGGPPSGQPDSSPPGDRPGGQPTGGQPSGFLSKKPRNVTPRGQKRGVFASRARSPQIRRSKTAGQKCCAKRSSFGRITFLGFFDSCRPSKPMEHSEEAPLRPTRGPSQIGLSTRQARAKRRAPAAGHRRPRAREERRGVRRPPERRNRKAPEIAPPRSIDRRVQVEESDASRRRPKANGERRGVRRLKKTASPDAAPGRRGASEGVRGARGGLAARPGVFRYTPSCAQGLDVVPETAPSAKNRVRGASGEGRVV